MSDFLIGNLVLGIIYSAIHVYKDYKLQKRLKKERETYSKIYQDSLDTLIERYVRQEQRIFILHLFDWVNARSTGQLLGLPFLLPTKVLESSEPIDVTKYFTDEESDAIRNSMHILKSDKRTAHLSQHFLIK